MRTFGENAGPKLTKSVFYVIIGLSVFLALIVIALSLNNIAEIKKRNSFDLNVELEVLEGDLLKVSDSILVPAKAGDKEIEAARLYFPIVDFKYLESKCFVEKEEVQCKAFDLNGNHFVHAFKRETQKSSQKFPVKIETTINNAIKTIIKNDKITKELSWEFSGVRNDDPVKRLKAMINLPRKFLQFIHPDLLKQSKKIDFQITRYKYKNGKASKIKVITREKLPFDGISYHFEGWTLVINNNRTIQPDELFAITVWWQDSESAWNKSQK